MKKKKSLRALTAAALSALLLLSATTGFASEVSPTPEPTNSPSSDVDSTSEPGTSPAASPTGEPTVEPSEAPSAAPTEASGAAPTAEPTESPTDTPSAAPSEAPTAVPSASTTPSASPANDGITLLSATDVDAGSDTQLDTSVAQIEGGKYFDTLPAAIAAAQDGATVKLLKDVNLASWLSIKTAITLDLNGQTITDANWPISNTDLLIAKKDGIVIKNGTITCTTTNPIKVNASGITVTLSNLTVSSVDKNTVIGSSSASLTAENCTFSSTGKGYPVYGSFGSLNLTSCTVSAAANSAIYADVSANSVFESCTVSNSKAKSAAAALQVKNGATLTVKGGTYTSSATSDAQAIELRYNSTSGSKLVLESPTVAGQIVLTRANAVIEITGGRYSLPAAPFALTLDNGSYTGAIKISGGLFSIAGVTEAGAANTALAAALDAGCTIVQNTDNSTNGSYPFTIQKNVPADAAAYYVGEGGANIYATSLTEAINSAGGKEVFLLKDADLPTVAAPSIAAHINTNGFKLSATQVSAANLLQSQKNASANLQISGALLCSDITLSQIKFENGALLAVSLPGTANADQQKAVTDVMQDGSLLAYPANTSNPFTIAPESSFALKIGKLGFTADTAAIAVASHLTDPTITLLKDLDSALTLPFASSSITIDLNGHKIIDGSSIGCGLIIAPTNGAVPNGLNVLIKNGSIEGTNFGLALNGNVSNATITLDNVEIQATADDGIGLYFPGRDGSTLNLNAGVSITGATGLAVKGGNINIVDGVEITATMPQASTPSAPMPGGVNSTGNAIYVEGGYNYPININITGGTFAVADTTADTVSSLFNPATPADKASPVEITGGTFATQPDESFCAEDFAPVQKDDGTFGVSNELVEAGGKKYPSIDAAIKAGKTDIKLLESFSEAVVIPEDKTIVLDLNGKTLTGTQPDMITIDNRGTLTIADSSAGQTGSVCTFGASDRRTALTNWGTFLLNGGTLNGGMLGRTAAVVNYGDTTIAGGSLTGTDALLNHGGKATITGGTLTGLAASISTGFDPDMTIDGSAVINGDVAAAKLQGINVGTPKVSIKGGSITGKVYNALLNENDFSLSVVAPDSDRYDLQITGGTFDQKPDDAFFAENLMAVQNADGKYVAAEYRTITFPAPKNGTVVCETTGITGENGVYKVPRSTSALFRFKPADGYVIDKILVDGEEIGFTETYTVVKNNSADRTVTVSFKVKPIDVKPTAEPTVKPTAEPTAKPTAAPTTAPTATPAPGPTTGDTTNMAIPAVVLLLSAAAATTLVLVRKRRSK